MCYNSWIKKPFSLARSVSYWFNFLLFNLLSSKIRSNGLFIFWKSLTLTWAFSPWDLSSYGLNGSGFEACMTEHFLYVPRGAFILPVARPMKVRIHLT
jgi:hypothetical protein